MRHRHSSGLFAVLMSTLALSAAAAETDYLILCDSAYTAQAQRLSALRQKYTPAIAQSPKVATMQAIYRSHPPTGFRWTSVRDFLKSTLQGNNDIKHVVLLGDADFRDDHPANLVPAFRQQIPSLTRFDYQDTSKHYYDTLVSEDPFVDGMDSVKTWDDTLRLRFAIGRIPASTPADADAYLDKLEAWESRYPYGPQAFTYAFLSDDDLQAGSYEGLDPIRDMPELHQKIWDALEIKPFVKRVLAIEHPLRADSTKPSATDSLMAMLNAGPGRFYYIGHGHHAQLTDEKVLRVPQDLTRLARKTVPPVMSFLACTTARFASPDAPSMGERLLFHPHGAIAVLGGTIPTFPRPNNELFIAWNRESAAGLTLGQAFAKAKRAVPDARNSSAYVLLGDPALSLHAPGALLPATGSGAGRIVLPAAAGDSAYFQLVTIDSLPFNAVIAPANDFQKDRLYPRERVIAEGRAAAGAGGTVAFTLPSAGDPKAAAVKAMVWNAGGMRYGHFPLESLSSALRPAVSRAGARAGYRMVVRGNRVMLERDGRLVGLDGRLDGTGQKR